MHNQLVELQLSCRTQTWRAEQLRRRLEARPQHIKRAEECQFESHPRVEDSNSAECDVTRMCKESEKCNDRKTRPSHARGTTWWNDDVVFGDITLLKNHVRQVCSVNLEPKQWQLAHDPLLQPRHKMRQQRKPEEDQPSHAQ